MTHWTETGSPEIITVHQYSCEGRIECTRHVCIYGYLLRTIHRPQSTFTLRIGGMILAGEKLKYLSNKHNQLHAHFTFTYTSLIFNVSTCFGHYLPILRRHYTDAELVTIVCSCRCGLVSGCGKTHPHLQLHTTVTNRVVPPEDGQVMPETCPRQWTSIERSESEVCIKLIVVTM
jgi:hypothetical protein